MLGITVIFGSVFFYSVKLNQAAEREYNRGLFLQFSETREKDRKEVIPLVEYRKKIQEVSCTADECLTPVANDELYGTSKVRGYYAQSKKDYFDKQVTCDTFVITDSSRLRQHFSNLIRIGNGVNFFNELSEPVINIDLSTLDAKERVKITSSTVKDKVDLLVLVETSDDHDAPECFSFIDILKVVPQGTMTPVVDTKYGF